MACFTVPVAEAMVTTIIKKKAKADNPFSKRLGWLNDMLWGGSALLAFEHLWHGEIVLWFPFLTRAANPADALEMLHEMSTSGVAMAVLVTAVWFGMVAATESFKKRPTGMGSIEK